jgi:UDP-N-acetylmuramyl pentapeptide phosphotransferase/UDP-N-acetylglucosamine-1-phosphate transferase
MYKYVWIQFISKDKVPSGFGVAMAIFMLLSIFKIDLGNFDKIFFCIIFFFGFIYWYDDFKYLNFGTRILIQFLSGFLICFIVLFSSEEFNINFLLVSIFFGFLNVFLTNIINFYDGADLNVSFLVIILSIIMYVTSVNFVIFQILSLSIISFTVGFAFLNAKPNTIYFGDSGCFVFSCVMIYFIVNQVVVESDNFVYLLIGLSLPIIDVLNVISMRLLKGESLLSRNYYHLYQIIQKKFNSHIYLIIQPLNCFLLILFFNYFLLLDSYNIVFASLLITIIFYYVCYYLISKMK